MKMIENILVTGAAGYIGSHTVLQLLESGYNVICIDNLCNAYKETQSALPESLKRVEELTDGKINFIEVDIRRKEQLQDVFKLHNIDCVIHFAALKAVGESCQRPLLYYQNNINGTSVLLETMSEAKVFKLVYSSSATVYGDPQHLPITESHPTGNCTSPYGKSKYFTEEILKDLCSSDSNWSVISLRYFNPVGAHPSGRIGEDPHGEPNNLMPFISQVAVGERPFVKIFGNNYPTKDGTGIRDYIHIVDLASGHMRAIEKLQTQLYGAFSAYNLGTGTGYSVLEVIKEFEKVSGRKVAFEMTSRRDGDIAISFADSSLAAKELKWTAAKGLKEMCEDTWRWQRLNPRGYRSPKDQASTT